MPQKHGPGCGCCAPCGFGCDPCLGSVEIDAGECGGATWSYPLPDPCTGIVTLSDPFCLYEDCLLDECLEWSSTQFADEYEECDPYCIMQFGLAPCSPFGGTPWNTYWVKRHLTRKAWIYTYLHKKYNVQIQFIGNKQMRVTVVCTVYPMVAQYTYLKIETYRTDPYCSATAACDPGVLAWNLVSTVESGVSTGPTTCQLPTENQAAYYRCSSDLGGLARYETERIFCDNPNDYVLALDGVSCSAVYEEIIDLTTCDDFLATFTLDRINADCGQVINYKKFLPTETNTGGNAYGANTCLAEICSADTFTLDDCWPATIDITLA